MPEAGTAKNNMVSSKVLIIDNFDSFTYNLNQIVSAIWRKPVDIITNDALDKEEINQYEYIFISPGPGLPHESGKLVEVLSHILEKKKIFGVCLGLQAIVEVCGGTLKNLPLVAHGIESEIHRVGDSLIYQDIPDTFIAGRYHSWVMDKSAIPEVLEIDAIDNEGTVMSIHHKSFPVYGVQYHPESIMTPLGRQIVKNFLDI